LEIALIKLQTWLPRILIGIVFLWNVQCALAFLLWPERYTPGFELAGAPGAAAIQGIGVLFLMWNVPYAVALWNPLRHRLSVWEAVVMQALGLLGESIIYLNLPAGHAVAQASLARFILFDGLGLLALLLAAWLVYSVKPSP
jgi:hypothetical protein